MDSSALLKLVQHERESEALGVILASPSVRISSDLATVEVMRRARPYGEATQNRAREVLDSILLRPIEPTVIDLAAALNPPGLRSLDAIHLATALSLEQLDVFISYDRRLNQAAAAAGLSVESPA